MTHTQAFFSLESIGRLRLQICLQILLQKVINVLQCIWVVFGWGWSGKDSPVQYACDTSSEAGSEPVEPEVIPLASNCIGAKSASRVHAESKKASSQANDIILKATNLDPVSGMAKRWQAVMASPIARGAQLFTFTALPSFSAAPKTTHTSTKDMKNSTPKPCINVDDR